MQTNAHFLVNEFEATVDSHSGFIPILFEENRSDELVYVCIVIKQSEFLKILNAVS